MSRIRGKDTKPEMVVRKALWAMGYRYRLNLNLIGKPDIVFLRAKTAVFVDGCFWHGCPIHGTSPKKNAEFWQAKIERNKKRDAEVIAALTEEGWMVVRAWEHDVISDLPSVIERITHVIASR